MKRFVIPLLAVALALQLSVAAHAQSKQHMRQWHSTDQHQHGNRVPQYKFKYIIPPQKSHYHGSNYPQEPLGGHHPPMHNGGPQYGVPPLALAIADGAPFVIQLYPGESYGTLIGGATYIGHFNPDSNSFTVSGPGRRPEDGLVIPLTASYRGCNPLKGEVSVWGAGYLFDSQGNLFVAASNRLAGTISLRQ